MQEGIAQSTSYGDGIPEKNKWIPTALMLKIEPFYLIISTDGIVHLESAKWLALRGDQQEIYMLHTLAKS